MKISSPMGTGSGAHVIHQTIADSIPGYRVNPYLPYWTLFPPALPLLFQSQPAPDLVHTTPDFGFLFARKNTPLVLTFHNLVLDSFMQCYSSFAQNLHYRTSLRYFTLKSLSRAVAITSVSDFTAELVRKELQYSGGIRTIYNGIDTENFKPAVPQKNRGIKVLFSGNLIRRKGSLWLPHIAEKLNPGITILYTSGLRTKNTIPERSNLKNIGKIPFTEMPGAYQSADILLFPTVREGFGLAAAEAMSCGLPVVATDCSSLPELVIEGKGGYLCELGNTEQFARRINELADSPSLRHEMGQFNRNRVENKFTLQQMINGYKELFEEVLSAHKQ